MTAVLFLLWATGFFSEKYDSRRWGLIVYLGFNVIFFWFVVVPMFHVNDRYLMPLFPIGIIWMGRGMIFLSAWIANAVKNVSSAAGILKFRKTLGWASVVTFVMLFGIIPELSRVLIKQKQDKDMWAEPVELKEAGIWLKSHTDQPPVLMSLNKAVDFYAGQMDMRKGASFSYDSVDRNLIYARNRSVEYLVVSGRYMEWFSNLKSLINDPCPYPGLECVYRETDISGITAVIYRLLPEACTAEGES
jgi:hypothetical protein